MKKALIQRDQIDFSDLELKYYFESTLNQISSSNKLRKELDNFGVTETKNSINHLSKDLRNKNLNKIIYIVRALISMLHKLDDVKETISALKLKANDTKMDLSSVIKDNSVIETLLRTQHQVLQVLTNLQNVDETNIETTIADTFDSYRMLLSIVAAISTSIDWQSISYESSQKPEIFNPSELDYDGTLAYKRVSYPALAKAENEILEQLVRNPDVRKDLTCILTSSGQGAYGAAEGLLTRFILKRDDAIAHIGKAYFETRAFTDKLPGFRSICLQEIDAEKIAKEVLSNRIRFLTVEPIYNADTINLLDIPKLIKLLDDEELEEDTYLLVDSSMLGGGFDPYKEALKNEKLHIMLLESLLKYRGMGFDKVNGGFLIAERKHRGKLVSIRAGFGNTLNDTSLSMLPLMTEDLFRKRMIDLSSNAQFVAERLQKFLSSANLDIAGIDYPGLPNHQDFNLVNTYDYLGGVFTLLPKEGVKLDRDTCHDFIKLVISKANIKAVQINHGTSFAFENTRIALADLDGGTFENAYIRFSIGRESKKDLVKLIEVLKESLVDFF